MALAALNVLVVWLPSGRRVRPLAITLLLAAGIAALVNVMASHAGADVLIRLPSGWPLVGGALTLESLAFGGALGLGVDPLSLKAELLTAVVIEAGAFDKLFVGHWKLSGTPKEEGTLIIGSGYLGVPFEESYVDEYLRPGSNTCQLVPRVCAWLGDGATQSANW